MGRRGPPPKPTALKKLQGTYQPCRSHPDEPELPVERPEPLYGLDDMERRHFARLASEVEELGTVSGVDGGALSSLAIAECRMLRAARQVTAARRAVTAARRRLTAAEDEIDAKTAGRVLQAAERSLGFWLRETHAAQQIDRQLRQEFGLTPSARSRVGGKPKEDKPEKGSRAALLFGGGRGA